MSESIEQELTLERKFILKLSHTTKDGVIVKLQEGDAAIWNPITGLSSNNFGLTGPEKRILGKACLLFITKYTHKKSTSGFFKKIGRLISQ